MKEMNVVLTIIIASLIIFFSGMVIIYADTYLPMNNHAPLKYDYKFDICEITEIEPYYDCRYTWLIVKINANSFMIPNSNQTVHGLAYWGYNLTQYVDIPKDDNEKYDALIILGKNVSDNCYQYFCMPLFIHESKHILCMCNWHKDLKTAIQLDKEFGMRFI